MPLPWNEVKAWDSHTIARLIHLPKCEQSEIRKWACPFCGSSDGLHAYPGARAGFGCWAACGADRPKGCRGYSTVDIAMAHWGTSAAEACARLAAILGIPYDYLTIAPKVFAVPNSVRRRGDAALTPSAQERNLAALSEIPGARLSPVLYADVVAQLSLTQRGAGYLGDGRRLDADAAAAYGYRSIDGFKDWNRLSLHLHSRYRVEELAAAGFPRAPDGSGLVLPFAGRFPALLIPFWRAGELIGLRFRNLLPDHPGYKHNRYRTLAAAKPLWPYHADGLEETTVHVVEGELNAETFRQLGIPAIGLSGAGAWLDPWTAALAGARRVVAWYDCGDRKHAGDRGAAALRARLAATYGERWTARRWRRMITVLDPNALHQRGHLAGIVESTPWDEATAPEVRAA